MRVGLTDLDVGHQCNEEWQPRVLEAKIAEASKTPIIQTASHRVGFPLFGRVHVPSSGDTFELFTC